MAKASRAKAAGTGISKAEALAYHFLIASEGVAHYLEPVALSRGRVAFRNSAGSPPCDSCGCEICSGRGNGEESGETAAREARPGWQRSTIVAGFLACAGCGKKYEVARAGLISEDEAERLGV